MKKLTILLLVLSLIALIYGCCSHSDSGISVRPQGDTVVTSREVIIDELGRLPTVTFPSGAKIEGLEDNTLTPGIVVTIIEQKMTGKNTAYFNASNDTGMYIYKITAFMNPTNSLGAKTYVTTTEKPVKITLPRSQNSQGIILAGIKESNTDPWRLFNYSDSDEILADIAGVRAAGTNIKDNTFSLFRFGTQFALVSYESNSGNRLPETYVTALNASSTPSILVKDGKYLEDLTIKGIIKGVKLDSIKPTDLRARITYRDNVADEAPIKVNGVNITQTSKADKTVPGYSYCHSFLIDSVSESNLMGNSGEFAFTLDLDGIETQSFSNGFLIEFFNKVDSEKVMPYNYTEFYTINNKDVVTLTITANGGNPDGLYELDPTFVINIGAELSDSDRQKIESAISVTGIEPGKITKVWNDSGLTIGFTEDLEPDTDYTLKIADVTDIDGISITDVEDLTFKTKQITPITTYAITYNLDGGTADNPTSYDVTSATINLTNPTKNGYTFTGWSGTGLTGNDNMAVSIAQGSNGDRTYTAHWSLVSYTITCNLNDGTLETANPTSYDVTSATITLNNPSKLGYEFTGWTGSNGNTPQTTVTIEQGTTGDKAYTAHWSEVAYVITYNLDGGEVATANPTGYNTASETFVLIEPTKVGYTFTGWTGSNGNTPQTTVTIEQGSTDDKEFTANWSINSYRLDLVKGTGINTVTGAGMYEYNSVVNVSYTMLDGYEFASWSGDLTTETFNMPASNATMTANARLISYNIVYELNGGTADNPTSYDITSATIVLNEPIKEGYTFLGWTGSNGNTPEKPLSIVQGSKSDLNFVANWSINSYRLDIVKGTGINTVTGDGLHEYNSVVNVSYTMLDGYEFASWSGDLTTETFNMPASNATMTANARPISYSIVYNLDSGQTTTDNPVYYDVTSATITLNNPTKIGYTFKGWSGTDLAGDSNITVTIPQGSTGDRSYTAHWSVNSYMLTLNKGIGINTITGDGMHEYNSVVTASCTMLDGFEFALWSGDFTTETFNMPASNATMTANARPISYNIVYNLDGGNATNPTSYDITSATITLNNPTKANYAFLGWEGTGIPNGTASLTVTIPQGSTGVRSYTASYTPMYTITYNLNGGSLAIANPATYTIYSDDIVLNKPTKDGIYFMGWTSDEFFGASMSVKIPQGSTGNKTYTANWGEILTFNLPNNLTLVMHKIPAGVFTMGSPTDELGRQSSETQHQVTLTKAFYIGRFGVTQDQYFAIMGTNPSNFREGVANNVRPTTSANYPVEKVSYTTARTFCASLTTYLAGHIPTGFSSFDLPTEAQWEYACRAGTVTALNNNKNLLYASDLDSNLSEVAWYSQNWGQSNNKTHTVGEKLPNAWGLYDMHGNLWEWCKDMHTAYPTEAVTDPFCDSGSYPVTRGGCWSSDPSRCRSAFRGYTIPSYTGSDLGFRLVLVPAP